MLIDLTFHLVLAGHRDLVMKLIHLRGVKYAKYFDSKDKTTNNQGWL